jgi:hypothetical protein
MCVYHQCIEISSEKMSGISFCKSELKQNPNPYSIVFPKVRGETCAREIYQGRFGVERFF